MKLKVRDQLHLSALGPDTMGKGHEFEVSDDVGADLMKRGLADPVEVTAAKAEAPPLNKAMRAAPANKASPKGKAKAKQA